MITFLQVKAKMLLLIAQRAMIPFITGARKPLSEAARVMMTS